MNFSHEATRKNIEYHRKQIELLTKDLNRKHTIQRDSVVWQVATDGELILQEIVQHDDTFVDRFGNVVKFKVDGINLFQFERFMDEVEEILADNGYEMNTLYSRYCEWSRSYDFYYRNERNDEIRIEVSSKTCRQVETGKLVPERTDVCNLFVA